MAAFVTRTHLMLYVITYLVFMGYDATLLANYLVVQRHIREKRDSLLCFSFLLAQQLPLANES